MQQAEYYNGGGLRMWTVALSYLTLFCEHAMTVAPDWVELPRWRSLSTWRLYGALFQTWQRSIVLVDPVLEYMHSAECAVSH